MLSPTESRVCGAPVGPAPVPRRGVEVLAREAQRPRARNLVFPAQPRAQPLSSVGVDRPIRRADRPRLGLSGRADQLDLDLVADRFGVATQRAERRSVAPCALKP